MSEKTTPNRAFSIGATIIQASMAHLDKEQIRTILKRGYPELTHATIRETTLADFVQVSLPATSRPSQKVVQSHRKEPAA